ncbi:hypothetical protein HDU91_000057 [Kappamyces sp. JEL0680]|nr:hypothetical protein HDU91_000057 [Kappamyces sp. JEL0680]
MQGLQLHTPLINSPHIPQGCVSVGMNRKTAPAQRPSGQRELVKTPTRQRLYERTRDNHSFPLPSTPLATRATIGTLSTMLNVMKNSVDWAQFWPSGRKGTLPSVAGTKVEKVTLPRLPMIMIDDQPHYDTLNDRMNAEWVWNSQSSSDAKDRVVLYSHGGAYVLSSRRTHRPITSRIAKYADCRVLSIDYRLAPKHTWPGPLVDVLSAYLFLLDSGYLAENISFCGDRDSIHSLNPFPIPGCVAVMSPFNDMTQSLPSWQLNKKYCYLPQAVNDPKYFSESRSNLAVAHDKDLIHPYASPIFGKSTDIPICPLLIQVGDAERVRDDGLYFATESCNDSEPVMVELYEDGVHVFQLFCPFDPFSDHALQRLGSFIKRNTAQDVKLPFERKGVRVHNAAGFPTDEFSLEEVHGILQDGVDLLIKQNIWKLKGDSMVTLHSE